MKQKNYQPLGVIETLENPIFLLERSAINCKALFALLCKSKTKSQGPVWRIFFSAENDEFEEGRVSSALKRLDRIFSLAKADASIPRPLVLGGGAKSLLKPLPGGSGGRSHPRPLLALGLAATRDAVNCLEDFGVPVVGPEYPPPEEFPDTLLILLGAVPGKGQPDIPEAWLDAIHTHHPILYVAGSPDAAERVPASSRGWSLPGLSPTLLGLILAGAEEEAEA